jgi:hypothetical protein
MYYYFSNKEATVPNPDNEILLRIGARRMPIAGWKYDTLRAYLWILKYHETKENLDSAKTTVQLWLDTVTRMATWMRNSRPAYPATTLIYDIGAGITAAAGTILALQLILDRMSTSFSFQLPDLKRPGIVINRHYLPVSGLGNLRACCLP